MSIQDTFRDAFTNLLAHGLRSGLTMLGIIMGVASLIVMISIVEGGQRWIVHSIERLGTNLLYVRHKQLTLAEQRKFAGRSTGLRYGDMVAIRQRDRVTDGFLQGLRARTPITTSEVSSRTIARVALAGLPLRT